IVDAEGAWSLIRHSPANVVEQCRRIGPVAAHRLDGLCRRKRALTAGEAVFDTALAIGPMTGRAVLVVDQLAMHCRSAALGQTLAVGADVDVPLLNFFSRGRTAEVIGKRSGC